MADPNQSMYDYLCNVAHVQRELGSFGNNNLDSKLYNLYASCKR